MRAPGKRWREYDLIGDLVREGCLSDDHAATNLGLFQTHFLVKNALYQLQRTMSELDFRLVIEPVEIYLEPRASGSCGSELPDTVTESPAVAGYYLDWCNFREASEDSVESLLQSFWERYVSFDDCAEALAVLGLAAGASYEQIRRRYRQLVMEHHPDRGGTKERVAELNEAMKVLQRYHRVHGNSA